VAQISGLCGEFDALLATASRTAAGYCAGIAMSRFLTADTATAGEIAEAVDPGPRPSPKRWRPAEAPYGPPARTISNSSRDSLKALSRPDDRREATFMSSLKLG
jgi:hypothetical protein